MDAVTRRRWLRWVVLCLGVHVAWQLAGPGGRSAVVVSDLVWIAAPASSAWLLGRLGPRCRAAGVPWVPITLVAGAAASWATANTVWAFYEVVLDRSVPSPSAADPFYVLALVLGVAGCAARLASVVSPSGAWRAVTDSLLLSGSLFWVLWQLVFVDTDGTIIWLYPALGIVAASLAVAAMSRVPARNRVTWLLVGAAFLTVAGADTAWAWQTANGGFEGGQLFDVVWVLGYLTLGTAAALAPLPAPGRRLHRSTTSAWELFLPYPPALVAVVLAASRYRDLGPLAVAGIVALIVLMTIRQLLAVVENSQLTRTLEARVAARTAELRDREAHFRALVQGISEVVMVSDVSGHATYVSPSVRAVLGYEPEEFAVLRLSEVIHPDDLPRIQALTDQLGASPDAVSTATFRCRRADGTWAAIEGRSVNLVHEPAIGGVLTTMRDVHERVALEERLRYQAEHDALTGLANRRRLQDELEHAVSWRRAPALVLLDLDEFKSVNDTSGHELGDEVLVAVAARLRDCTRPGDLVGRVGGDEFAIVVADDPDGTAAWSVAQRILDDFARPLLLDGRDQRWAASLGVAALAPGQTAADLVRDADVAMYVAKRRGRGRAERFTRDMHSAVLRRQVVEDRLRAAIADGSLVVHYQPVVDLVSGRAVGAEALVRLPALGGAGPDGELVPPGEFVALAEETGLIVPLGAWVLERACSDALGWQGIDPDGSPLGVSVNVSTRQLQGSDLAGVVAGVLASTGLDPSRLTLEITEGALDADDVEAEAALLALRAIGVRLSVDDFGAGYSSLGRLRTAPVHEVKIDRSFVAELAEVGADGGGTAPLIEAILALGDRLALDVVMEGLETEAEVDAVRAKGCRFAQGYHFARPMPDGELRAWLGSNLITRDSTSVVQSL